MKKIFAVIFCAVILTALIGCGVRRAPAANPIATPAASSSELVTPTPAAIPILDEIDCMAGCHRPDPSLFPATPPPALASDHVGRAACLTCHSNQKNQDWHITHQGRTDSTCVLCHLAKSSAK